jgi:hypothetical protein
VNLAGTLCQRVTGGRPQQRGGGHVDLAHHPQQDVLPAQELVDLELDQARHAPEPAGIVVDSRRPHVRS